jgi:RNA polymerase sigma factor (sigma-70 family)
MEQSVRFAVPDRANAGSLPLGRGDERLARLVGTGHDRAFAMLFERYHQPLYRYCRSLVRNDEDAQDALQSTMIRALVALRSGQRDAPLRPWLYRIAHNESISLLRRRPATDELGDAVACTSLSPEEDVAQRERLATLVADLQELPERQRGALVMRELAGLAHTEIATTLGISVGAAKQTIFEARCGLAEFTEGRAMACDDVLRAISDGDGRGLRGRRIRAHLRACATCSMFTAAIPSRERDLAALAPPVAPLAAAGLMTQLLGAGTSHGAGGSGVAVAAAGKSVSVALAAKAAVGIAIVATAAAVLAPAKHTVKPAATSTTRSAPWVGGRHAAAPPRSVISHDDDRSGRDDDDRSGRDDDDRSGRDDDDRSGRDDDDRSGGDDDDRSGRAQTDGSRRPRGSTDPCRPRRLADAQRVITSPRRASPGRHAATTAPGRRQHAPQTAPDAAPNRRHHTRISTSSGPTWQEVDAERRRTGRACGEQPHN